MKADQSDRLAKSIARTANVLASDFISVFGRLKEATGAKTDTDLAKFLGLRQSTISAAKSKKEIPPGWIIEISSKLGISSDWLLYGAGAMRLDASGISSEASAIHHRVPSCDPEIILIPKVKARLNAGTGSLETNGDVAGLYAFRARFLNRKGNPKEMVLMDVFGDSMEPEIMDGDSVLIDQSQTEIIPGRIYAIGIGEEVVVKRLDKTPEGLVLISTNKEYPRQVVNMQGDLADGVRPIGRIIWWCREAR